MTSFVFDVDGVIMDTRPLVRASYAAIGIQLPPDAWGKPWRDWLPQLVCDQWGPGRSVDEVHASKNLEYIKLLYEGRGTVLPAANLAMQLVLRGSDVRFLTSASKVAARGVLQRAGLWHANALLAYSASTKEKIAALINYAPSGIYVDDNGPLLRQIVAATSWHGVQYTHQRLEELALELSLCMG